MAEIKGSLEQEARTQLKGLASIFAIALETVADDLAEELRKQIYENVYDKWPEPAVYVRRYEAGGIADTKHNFWMAAPEIESGQTVSASAEFSYEPNGEWMWREPRNENPLIQRIESGEDYEWGTYDPPQRPFWKPFVESLYGRSKIAVEIDSILARYLKADGYEGIATIEHEPGDGDYSY